MFSCYRVCPEVCSRLVGSPAKDRCLGKPPLYGADIFTEIHRAAPMPLAERREALENTGSPIPPEWERTVPAQRLLEPGREKTRPALTLENEGKAVGLLARASRRGQRDRRGVNESSGGDVREVCRR